MKNIQKFISLESKKLSKEPLSKQGFRFRGGKSYVTITNSFFFFKFFLIISNIHGINLKLNYLNIIN